MYETGETRSVRPTYNQVLKYRIRLAGRTFGSGSIEVVALLPKREAKSEGMGGGATLPDAQTLHMGKSNFRAIFLMHAKRLALGLCGAKWPVSDRRFLQVVRMSSLPMDMEAFSA
ncbi:hypothetical protein DL89DRAFT_255229 [Linderina pennispora]|uniref:Uncharacterized protein n=1 Tax=Linderina pennispora TaxID=61395 RepID=A0A1Y1WI93_9FUNG|nr:uncharacterized protein DL89DRAFT_255229 [Linderina pennispora]ORX73085.1 hypothetical protein DL89DRAFT_255229 [Linderina pennispora]